MQRGSGRRQVAFSHGGVATAGSAMRGVGMGGETLPHDAHVLNKNGHLKPRPIGTMACEYASCATVVIPFARAYAMAHPPLPLRTRMWV